MSSGPSEATFLRVGRALDLGQRRIRFRISASPLNPWRVPVLRRADYAGKRVIIIGPASTVADDLAAGGIDDFDVVVRLNNGIALAQRHPDLLGLRTDVLFHNLKEGGDRSAGAIPPELLRVHGVTTCVFPHWGFKGNKDRFYRKRRQLQDVAGITLKVTPPAFCERTRLELGGMQPTVGSSAILFFLGCELCELAIHGFTFFETPYLAGYNDAVDTPEAARLWARASQVHAPGLEKSLIGRRVAAAESQGMTVTLGRNVRRHLIA